MADYSSNPCQFEVNCNPKSLNDIGVTLHTEPSHTNDPHTLSGPLSVSSLDVNDTSSTCVSDTPRHVRLAAETLRSQLHNSRKAVSPSDIQRFIPLSAITEHIAKEKVDRVLKELYLDKVARLSKWIVGKAPQLFAILILCQKEDSIKQFFNDDIGDKDLPFFRPRGGLGPGVVIRTNSGQRVRAIEDWHETSLLDLESFQNDIRAPVFQKWKEHSFSDERLPFVWPTNGIVREGSTASVVQLRVPTEHSSIDTSLLDENMYVAVKTPRKWKDFESEQITYRLLSRFPSHPHLIKPLFSFTRGEKDYGLVFPWADRGTLREHWESNPIPDITQENLFWGIEQMAGVAGALGFFHNAHDPDCPDEPLFVRHSDITAGNMLLLRGRKNNPCSGTVKISDLGSAHVRGSTLGPNINPDVMASPTYSPPERRQEEVTDRWDVWSLGGFYLEFITWALLGNKGIQLFAARRGHDEKAGACTEDTFYSTKHSRVRPAVCSWVRRLKSHPYCSPMLVDVLDMIMQKMIVMVPEHRSSAVDIEADLKDILTRARQEEGYAFNPGMHADARRSLINLKINVLEYIESVRDSHPITRIRIRCNSYMSGILFSGSWTRFRFKRRTS